MTKEEVILLEDVLQKFDSKIYYDMKNYNQFTIDFIENHIQDFDDAECNDKDYIDGLIYEIDNVLNIIKDGKDKDLFTELKQEIEKL